MINIRKFAITGLLVAAVVSPMAAQAQTVTHWVNRQLKVDDHYDLTHNRRHHQDTGANAWRNLSYAGGGVAVAGILTGNSELIGIGVAAGLYSTYRYEEDRNSRNPGDRKRFSYFSQSSRTINGDKYNRVTVMSNGHHYYAYKRS